MAAADRLTVGIVPASAARRRRRLLRALELAFPVRFAACDGVRPRGLAGLLCIGSDPGTGAAAASAAAAGLPTLALQCEEPPEPGAAAPLVAQELAAGELLDRRLHGAELPDGRLAAALAATLSLPAGAAVLASCRGRPTWARSGSLHTALLAPEELGETEALRNRLGRERSAALLPLVHFLRELTAPIAWQPPPQRAAFVFDDPNLHWPSYGFLDLAELSRHARAHGYHAALAMVPLDAWFAHPGARRALLASGGAISLLVHGNDHDGGEFGRAETEWQAIRLGAQALRRVSSFENRTGIPVDRIMVPPHEACSEATVRGLARCGFEGISMTLPFPWLAEPAADWLARPPGSDPLIAWRPSDFTLDLPLLLRHPVIGRDPAELRLRAFLDQPLILYGHHDDVGPGLDVLAAAAAEVDAIAAPRWCSLGEIAAGNFETRRRGEGLTLRLLGARADLIVPDGTRTLTVELPPFFATPERQRLEIDGSEVPLGEPLPVSPGARLQLRLRSRLAVDPAQVAPPPRRRLALARRVASQGRDRLRPLAGRFDGCADPPEQGRPQPDPRPPAGTR